MVLLEVENLSVNFYTEEGVVNAIDDLSFSVDRGEKFGVVGESGAGKSVSAFSILRLVESPGVIENGSIRLHDGATVDRFKAKYPDSVVDVGELRAAHDLADLASRLAESGGTATDLTNDPAHEGTSPTELVPGRDFEMGDVLDSGRAVEVGLVEEGDFVVEDGDRRYVEILRAPEAAVRSLRGNNIAMIFQEAQTALNPVYSVGEQISEAIRHHLDYSAKEARKRAVRLLDEVGIPDAESRYSDYPHQFSGGMQQRAVIAMALSCDPDLLIADEPTTALDVTIEAKILEQLEELAEEFDTAIQLITHDLGVIAEICDRVMVMYAGKPVEKATVEELFYDPKHPYTVGLMSSIPRIGDRRERLQTIPGTMPDMIDVPSGCSFHPRCPYAEEVCTRTEPPLVDTGAEGDTAGASAHEAACLEYTGDLQEGLDYEVSVRDEPTTRTEGEN